MATDIIMPQMGFDMQEGRIVRWLKQEGDAVERGEAIAEVETDKAVVEVEAFAAGVLRRVIVGEGETVPVGTVVGIIAAPSEELPESPTSTPVAPAAVEAPAPSTSASAKAEAPLAQGQRVRVSPVARRLAEQGGIDLSQVQGTGPGGRILRDDVDQAIAQRQASAAPAVPSAAPAAPPVTAATAAAPPGSAGPIPGGLSPMRQAIARRMSQSKREIPHFYITMEVDMTSAMALRRQINQELDEASRISVNDLVVRACAKALATYPDFNVLVLPEGIQRQEVISISLAIALDQGLIAPALVDIGSASLPEIARASKNLVERARGGGLRPDEYSGGGFAVSNMGMYGVSNFTAIITPPNGAALAVGSVEERAVVREGRVAAAQMMSATVSADHRATDGAQAAQFLGEIKGLLEAPGRLLM